MNSSEITEVAPNTFTVINQGIQSKLTFIGDGEWLLEIGQNSFANLKSGAYRRKIYLNLERLELENPHWKGISLLFSTCPVHSQSVRH